MRAAAAPRATEPLLWARSACRSHAGVSELAPITSGPYQGDLGVVFAEPSEYLRVTLE